MGAAGCGGKGAHGEDKEDGCTDGENGELRELLTGNGRARGPGVEDDDTRQCGGEHQEGGVGEGFARHTSWEEAAGVGAFGAWIGTGAPSAAMAATDATEGAWMTPRSVMMAVTYLAGVTSKAGFSIST